MPPVNTPLQRSPDSEQTPVQQRPLTPISHLASPVPDSASAAHTPAAEAANQDNISFLRDSLDSLDRATQTSPRPAIDAAEHPPSSRETETQPSPSTQWLRTERSSLDAQRDRLPRYLSHLQRLHNAPAPTASAYSNRTPSPHRQSLYDWAPALRDRSRGPQDIETILHELRRERGDNVDTAASRLLDSRGHSRHGSDTSNGMSHDMAAEDEQFTERRRRDRERQQSLRNRALLHRARQDGSPSETESMLRYLMDRERSGISEEEERARGTNWYRLHPGRTENEENRYTTGTREHWALRASEVRERDRQERVDAFRRGYLAEDVPPRLPRLATPPVPSTTQATNLTSFFLENALKYLDSLRYADTDENVLGLSLANSIAGTDIFMSDRYVRSIESFSRPSPTSWLQPGAIFEGHQHASSASLPVTRDRSGSSAHMVEQINPNYRVPSTNDNPPGSTRVASYTQSRTPLTSHGAGSLLDPRFRPTTASTIPPIAKLAESLHDHWPVRVIIHKVDWERMTLQGTMEAYDVPQHSAGLNLLQGSERPKAGRKNAPITTYLEGHVIDLRVHSFLTPRSDGRRWGEAQHSRGNNAWSRARYDSDDISFPAASPAIDTANWRKLPPFSALATDHDMARMLLSSDQLKTLSNEYIFMRWKERCFVHGKNDQCTENERRGDQDRGHGLTISGFYYIIMRRSDGQIEGLYFDPTSTPYQHLRLSGLKATWPAWEFR